MYLLHSKVILYGSTISCPSAKYQSMIENKFIIERQKRQEKDSCNTLRLSLLSFI
ncbi:hypothetical protein EDO6_02208 [Paenibacillus xylanexedens]|nr:hypothetical protein EDO6_02208 [Paenibacillus xylanexedens]